MAKQWLGQRFSSLPVGKKIGLGYALALGVALSGTLASFGIGDLYQRQAALEEEHARNEVSILQRLQARVLQVRTHQQQLIPLVASPDQFQGEYSHLRQHRAEIHFIWGELKRFLADAPEWRGHGHATGLPEFLDTYERVPRRYSHALAHRVDEVRELAPTTPAEIEQARALLLDFTNSDVALEFDQISDNLTELIAAASQELEVAIAARQRVDALTRRLAIASIGLSVAIAIVVAIVTSRAIAQPIQLLTSVARRSTAEANFDLQADISRQDEIGTLAETFNQLIRAVNDLLQEQQTANAQLAAHSQTLESEVAARTADLNEKNEQLQQLLAELQQTQVQMVQSEKMSALGQMVAGVAHEINNPVNFIHGNLTHLETYTGDLLGLIQLYQHHYPDPTPEIATETEDIDLEFIRDDLPQIVKSMTLGTSNSHFIFIAVEVDSLPTVGDECDRAEPDRESIT